MLYLFSDYYYYYSRSFIHTLLSRCVLTSSSHPDRQFEWAMRTHKTALEHSDRRPQTRKPTKLFHSQSISMDIFSCIYLFWLCVIVESVDCGHQKNASSDNTFRDPIFCAAHTASCQAKHEYMCNEAMAANRTKMDWHRWERSERVAEDEAIVSVHWHSH